MRLVYTATRKEVAVGDKVTMHNGGDACVTGWERPRSPVSSGRVYVIPESSVYESSYYPSVIGAEWIEREDRA